MPELPEVETTRRGIEPHIIDQTIKNIAVRQRSLRWPIPKLLAQKARNRKIEAVERRGKYLLFRLATGTIIVHLGMSGSLRICSSRTPVDKHDHVDFVFGNNLILRLRDPRRFGAVLWTAKDPGMHKLLSSLGPEPLQQAFNGEYLETQDSFHVVCLRCFIN